MIGQPAASGRDAAANMYAVWRAVEAVRMAPVAVALEVAGVHVVP
jgi:hypothetical protein